MTLYKFGRFEKIYNHKLFGSDTDLYEIYGINDCDTLLDIIFPRITGDSDDDDADYNNDESIFQVHYWNRRTDVMESLKSVGSIDDLGYYTIQLLPERVLFQNKELRYDYRIQKIAELANRASFGSYVEGMKEEAGKY